MAKIVLLSQRTKYIRIYLNGKYLHTETYIELYDPSPRYTDEYLNQLSKCC